MKIEELESFLTAVHLGNLSRAADQLFITQPALTHRIRALEQELGYELIVRSPGIRKIRLTPKGQKFMLLAEQWIRLWQSALELKDADTVERFNITGIESIHPTMEAVCKKFIEKHQNIQLAIKIQYSAQAYQEVSNHLANLGIISDPQHYKNILCTPVLEEEMFFACRRGADYPAVIDPQNLEPRDAIFVPWSSTYELWYQYWFSQKTPYRLFTQSISLIKSYIAIGQNWCIVPAIIANWLSPEPGIEIHRLGHGPEPRKTYFITNRDLDSPYYDEICHLVKQELKDIEGVSVLL